MTMHQWQEALLLVGLVIEGLGIAVAIRGLRATWREYSTDSMFPRFQSFMRALAGAGGWLRSRLAFLFGPTRRSIRVVDSARITDSVSGLSKSLVDWEKLPDDHEDALAEVDVRLRRLLAIWAQQDIDWRTAINDIRGSVGLELAEEAAARREAVRQAAIAGATTAMKGLAMVIFGIGLQAVAAIWVLLSTAG